MSSDQARPGDDAMDAKLPLNEMLELMRKMHDILHECSMAKCEETQIPQNSHSTRSPVSPERDQRKQEQDILTAGKDISGSFNQPFRVPSKRFGMKKQQVQTNPIAANYDYRLKYPEDERYKEHDEEARVWWVYNDEAAAFDKDMIEELGDSLDVLLIFAGLFSAVITTFVAQTFQALSVDDEMLSMSYLGEIAAILHASGNISTISHIPTVDTAFSPATEDIWVNGLWFTSLTTALSVALFAVLAKQWLRQYMSIVTGTPRERAFIRQFRFDGLKAWKVQAIIGVLPVLLHLSLGLFLIGLVVFLHPLNTSIAYVTGIITAAISVLYLSASILPVYIVQCPYRTTFSDLLYYILRPLRLGYRKLWSCFCSAYWSIRYKEEYWEGPSTIRDFTSLKNVERHAACHARDPVYQDMIFRALWWLGEYTSNISAKEILRHSLGAFTPRMSNRLCTQAGLRVLYGCMHYQQLVSHAMACLDSHSKLERFLRSMLHLSSSKEFNRVKSLLPILAIIRFCSSDWDIKFVLAFCALDIPFKEHSATLNASQFPVEPSEALSWLVDHYFKDTSSWYDIKVPSLVWAGLFKASSNTKFKEAYQDEIDMNSWITEGHVPIECPVPISILTELAKEGKGASVNEVHGMDEPIDDERSLRDKSGPETVAGDRVGTSSPSDPMFNLDEDMVDEDLLALASMNEHVDGRERIDIQPVCGTAEVDETLQQNPDQPTDIEDYQVPITVTVEMDRTTRRLPSGLVRERAY
ncbi:hypothetical protein F5878DRAFT_366208 [Lentinula raphanica]|uniref:DUF6535 domain-containing protein n=1 Tax=Lentinula raphanica TaxID=153919 RepID=A0AA38PHH4_9AGAR|nr:hypothetical protein F5878DRAFT_366208 [Lentinula raphanica]